MVQYTLANCRSVVAGPGSNKKETGYIQKNTPTSVIRYLTSQGSKVALCDRSRIGEAGAGDGSNQRQNTLTLRYSIKRDRVSASYSQFIGFEDIRISDECR